MFPFCATKDSLEETGLALTAVLGHRMVLQQKQKEQLSHGTGISVRKKHAKRILFPKYAQADLPR